MASASRLPTPDEYERRVRPLLRDTRGCEIKIAGDASTPDPGTQVTLSVTLGLNPVPTEFFGNLISTPPGDNEYEIAMIQTRKGGGSGLVYQGHGECFLYILASFKILIRAFFQRVSSLSAHVGCSTNKS